MRTLALPIAARELLVLSRAATTWRQRLGNSFVVFVFGVLFALLYSYLGQIGTSRAMHLIGVGLSLMCLFLGVSLTADSIAQEKRAGTLGLLFLTNLSAFEIVLGKLVAHAVSGFYYVLCALPLLSMSMIFGGMRFSEVLLYLLAALNILFFSAAAGLFASSLCRDRGRATFVGIWLVIFFWAGVPILALSLKSAGAPLWLFEAFAWLSLNLASGFNIGLGRLLPSTPEWWTLAWPLILAWVLISLAAWRLRGWHDEPAAKRWRLRNAWKAICYGGPAARLKLRRKLLDRNPFMWLASRDRLLIATIWMVSVAALAFEVFDLFRGPLQVEITIGTAIALAFVAELGFSQAVTAQLLREYEQGTLEMVLSTPLSAQDVIDGQIAAARRQYMSLCTVAFVLFWAGVIMLAWQGGAPRFRGAPILATFSGLFLLQLYAISWVSMWSVLKAPDPKKATSNGFFLVTILPALLCGAIAAAANVLAWLAGIRLSPPPALLMILAFLLAFGNCIYWLHLAKRELPDALRLFAFQRYTPREPKTLFGQIGKLLGRLYVRAFTPPRSPDAPLTPT